LFVTSGMAHASSLTSTQLSAILSLLQSFGADQSTINNVSVALGGPNSTNASCLNLSGNLTLGSSGSDVTSLQDYLISKGDLTGTGTTGYYGYLTASAVGQLQISLGIVSFQSDAAYGVMGPRTRAAVGCGGTMPVSSAQPAKDGTGLFATPTSGAAPLTVSFQLPQSAGGTWIDFGDGTNVCEDLENECDVTGTIPVHTYSSPGTYLVTVTRHMPSSVIGKVTITVLSGASQ
jgi:peptidoglycan hydrolase-like protein with peptidoglycan-binding domain